MDPTSMINARVHIDSVQKRDLLAQGGINIWQTISQKFHISRLDTMDREFARHESTTLTKLTRSRACLFQLVVCQNDSAIQKRPQKKRNHRNKEDEKKNT